MISCRDLLFGAVFALAIILGGVVGGLLGDITHLVWGALGSGGIVYLIWRCLGWF